MTIYDLRLYKRTQLSKGLCRLVQQIVTEADSEAIAIEKAREAQIPQFDDSDFAMLFSEGGKNLWRLKS